MVASIKANGKMDKWKEKEKNTLPMHAWLKMKVYNIKDPITKGNERATVCITMRTAPYTEATGRPG